MAKKYEIGPMTRLASRIVSWTSRRGIGRSEVLTTTGRKSGEPRSLPVSPLRLDGAEYLVSPYGQVGWVHNARANPLVDLRHGSTTRRVRLDEVGGTEAATVASAYHARENYARQYMDVPETPTLDDFEARVDRFPVFRVVEQG